MKFKLCAHRIFAVGFLTCLMSSVGWSQKFGEPWNYNLLNGLPSTEVYELFRDSKGFIWFGSDLGVTRFDGQKFRTFNTEDGLGTNVVLRCFEDKTGRIWFFHLGSKPSYFYKDRIHQIECGDEIKISSKSRFVEMPDSTVLLGGFGGIVAIDKNSTCTFHKGNYTRMHYVTVAEHNGDLLYYPGNFKRENMFVRATAYERATPTLKYSKQIISDHLDSLFYNGILNYNGMIRSADFLKDLINTDQLDLVGDERLFNCYEVKRKGNMVFASSTTGFFIYRIVDKKLELQQKLNPDEAISSSVFDLNGGLWIGSLSKGLFHYPIVNSKPEIFDGANVVYTQKLDGSFFIANENGHVLQEKNGLESFSYTFEGDSPDLFLIKEIKRIGNNLVFLTTYGCYFLSEKGMRRVYDKGTYYSCIYDDKKDVLLLSTSDGVLVVKPNFEAEPISGSQNLFRVFNFAFYENEIYAADLSGLYVVRTDSIFPAFNGTFNNKRVNFVKNINGNLVVATANDGIYIKSDNELFHFSKDNGLLSSNAEFIVESDNHRFWVVGDRGPQLVELVNGKLKQWSQLDLKSVIRSTDLYQVEDFDGYLYLSTLFETYRFKIEQINNLQPLNLFVTEVKANGKVLDQESSAQLKLDQGTNNLSIELSGINYSKYPTTYHYRLNNGEWTQTKSGLVNMNALSPGAYLFEGYATSPFYQRSKMISVSFSIQGAFYQSIWFYVLISVLLITISSLIIGKVFALRHHRKKRLMRLELQALQSQMNPHFTFNTLNSIQNFILKNKTRESLDYLARFAQLMRMILDQSRLQVIPISEELKFLRIYLSLERLRMEEVFDFEFEIDPEINSDEIGIPSMLLQPFVENSVWHGFGNIAYPGKLKVEISMYSDHLLCTIIDNGIGRNQAGKVNRKEKGHKSQGSIISQERMHIFQELYGQEIRLTISDAQVENPIGTKVSVKLPLLKI